MKDIKILLNHTCSLTDEIVISASILVFVDNVNIENSLKKIILYSIEVPEDITLTFLDVESENIGIKPFVLVASYKGIEIEKFETNLYQAVFKKKNDDYDYEINPNLSYWQIRDAMKNLKSFIEKIEKKCNSIYEKRYLIEV